MMHFPSYHAEYGYRWSSQGAMSSVNLTSLAVGIDCVHVL